MQLRLPEDITREEVTPGTFRRILPYAWRYRWALALLLIVTALDSIIIVANPLILKMMIDNAILPRRLDVLIVLTLIIAGLALVDAIAIYVQTWCSARVGAGVVFNLRTQAYRHVQQQSLAFFNRTQTGSLVSRLDTDVVEAQEAISSLPAQLVSAILTLVLVLITMFYLSWQISVISLATIPVFLFSGKLIGKRLQLLTREQMQREAELASLMNERFNVAGAMVSKLYGRPDEESGLFARQAAAIRDLAILSAVYSRGFFIIVSLVTALTTVLVYGLGGSLVIDGTLKLGTIVAMIILLNRLYGPINQLTGMQIDFLTALVSFDRVFEILDLEPLVTEHPQAVGLLAAGPGDGTAPQIEFDQVSFRYPAVTEISVASLETIALPGPESPADAWILNQVSFHAPANKLTALVGPSGAGKTTIAHLVPRLYDPASGTVRIGGRDIRELTLESLRDTVGVVTQDTHLFHDTIRANLAYACPGATERELIEACEAARIWDLIFALPDGLDTVAGDRGYRFSGGEKQRLALARLMLKAPPVVVLDEATAHLDSETESVVQQALKTALAGRTSLVIAHRLSTIREAHQILVIDSGAIRERGTHDQLLAAGGLYAELCRIQFTCQPPDTALPAERANPETFNRR
jgi:ATP-binding cassette, subfamily B, bacterial